MKKKIEQELIAAMVLSLASWGAGAQQVYRCGNAYSERPCEDGRSMALEKTTPSESDQARARSHATRDAQLAEALEQKRLRDEAQPVSAYIPGAAPQGPRADGQRTLNRPIKPSPFRASTAPKEPPSPISKKKASRKKKTSEAGETSKKEKSDRRSKAPKVGRTGTGAAAG